ncbi:hypothetical protein [Hymenobacter sp. CRA2]|uniref:hypothetical protein n=1 Tax=Hymenobacter sp. CRA2 TaxID=1955620 RepID=UPI00098EB76F|nr:hypothetical protein [Hymenobacter sp. CRA2]OON69375.1 hypothetical protein B0919_08820 [Hymenobacter sp. CRA2]
MIRILLLCFALLVSSIASTAPAEAARISAYARAKMKGRVYTHRPNYKRYKGWKFAKRHSRSKAGKIKRSKASSTRAAHTTTRF